VDAQFWYDLMMVLPAEILPVTALLAMIEARQDAEAGVEPGFYP
jgi:hypothetical protein